MTAPAASGAPLPNMAPPVDLESQPFWDATAEQKLMLKRCDDCGEVIWYPRMVCPECHSTNTSWFQASGRGTVYTYTVSHRGRGPWSRVGPYVIAYVQLEEGPRMMTNIVDCDPESVECGMDVEVVFHDTGEGPAIPRFRPRP